MKPAFLKLVRHATLAGVLGIAVLLFYAFYSDKFYFLNQPASSQNTNSTKDYIKWVDFNVTSEAMNDAYQYDLKAHDTDTPIDWVSLLAVLGVKYGGDFKNYKTSDMAAIAEPILNKQLTLDELTKDMKHYDYYNEAYHAVLGGFVGTYQIPADNSETDSTKDSEEKSNTDSTTDSSTPNKTSSTNSNIDSTIDSTASNKTSGTNSNTDSTTSQHTDTPTYETVYGLKAFSPIAKGFPYSDYDDFGVSRSFGYRRQHLGHDMMGQIGTPIIAVESGYVECLGWNRYGGWRIGIRSFDKKRYYYYAHLRQDFPYCKSLKEGSIVTAGDVIGYMGHTGYSDTENVNNIDIVHLHFGMQLIFDESQKEGNNEIWISCYELTRFLAKHRSETVKDEATKEWYRVQDMIDPEAENYEVPEVPQGTN